MTSFYNIFMNYCSKVEVLKNRIFTIMIYLLQKMILTKICKDIEFTIINKLQKSSKKTNENYFQLSRESFSILVYPILEYYYLWF